MSILVEKLIQISIENYYNYINKLFNDDDRRNNKINIYNDIYDFMDNFLKQYEYQISLNLLLQKFEIIIHLKKSEILF